MPVKEKLNASMKSSRRVTAITAACVVLVVVALSVLHRDSEFTVAFRGEQCEMPLEDGGDCQALGRRRPTWACPEKMRAALPEFLKLYERRPLWVNMHGMRIEHSFGVWYTLRNIRPRPTTIIESGVHNGHSTWMLMNSLPGARMFCLDPSGAIGKHKGPTYYSGSDFKDFNQVNWTEHNIDFSRTLFFVDDHQSGYRRVIQEGRRMGIKHYMIDDNYHYLTGDNYSFKWTCERERKESWPGTVPDDIAKMSNKTTWEEHLEHGEELKKYVKAYYEFPPFGSATDAGLYYHDRYRTTPLLNGKELQNLNNTFSTNVYEEMKWYFNFLYVELY